MRSFQTPHMAYGHASSLAPTPLERLHGRLMRASAPPGGAGMQPAPQNNGGGTGGFGNPGATQGSGGDNSTGNSGEGNGSGGTQNNGGQGFDASSFWSEPSSSGQGAPASRGSDGSGSGGGGEGGGDNGNAEFGRQLGQRIQGLDYGNFMTQEMAGQIGEGNFDSFNQALTANNRRLAQDTMQMAVSVMQRFGDQIMGEVERRMGSQFSNRENQQALVSEIPLAGDPTMSPVVQSVFTQAMKHHGNDRAKAIAMTKQMLQHVHSSMQGDGTGLNIAPPNPGDSGGGFTSNTNWLEELAGRPG